MEHLTIAVAEKNGFDIAQAVATNLDRYSYEQSASRLGIGDSKLRRFIRELDLIVEREGKTPYLTLEQFDAIAALHNHEKDGGSIKTFKQLVKSSQLVKEEQPVHLVNSQPSQLVKDKYWGDQPVQTELDPLLRNAMDEIAMSVREQAYAQLEVRMRTSRDISDDEVIVLFGWKPPRTGFRESCYEFIRYGKTYKPDKDGKPVSVTTWKIKKIDLEAEARLKAEKKNQKKLEAAKMADEGISAYEDMKEMINSD